MTLKNKYGRCMNTLDILKLQVDVGSVETYSLVSRDEYPICGQWMPGVPSHEFVALEWSMQP